MDRGPIANSRAPGLPGWSLSEHEEREPGLLVVSKDLGHTDTRMVEKHYGHLAPNYAPRYRNRDGKR
jgi:hypothetical protein